MKCSFGGTFLTGTPFQEGVGEVLWSAEQPVDIVNLIGAASVFVTGRGNIQETIPVPITLGFDTPEAALAYIISLPWSLPPQGPLRFEEGNYAVEYSNAAFVNVERQRHGTQVDLTYEFVVTGPPIINPPAPPNSIVFPLNNTFFDAIEFVPWTALGALPAGALLQSISVNAILTQAVGNTYASDLTFYMGAIAPDFDDFTPGGGVLQVGGDSNLGTPNRLFWDNGYNNVIGTPVTGFINLSYLNLVLSNSNPFVGCGWQQGGAWTGSITIGYLPA